MFLPEHKEALLQHKKEGQKKMKPEYDEQMLRLIGYTIHDAYKLKCRVKVTTYGEYEDREYNGVVTKIDQQLKRIKVENEDHFNWIKIDDILLIDPI